MLAFNLTDLKSPAAQHAAPGPRPVPQLLRLRPPAKPQTAAAHR